MHSGAQVKERAESYDITVLSAPREGKKLLVCDIDYTLYDHRSVATNFRQLTRPFLHEMFQAVYEHYDIAIWSATSMKWCGKAYPRPS